MKERQNQAPPRRRAYDIIAREILNARHPYRIHSLCFSRNFPPGELSELARGNQGTRTAQTALSLERPDFGRSESLQGLHNRRLRGDSYDPKRPRRFGQDWLCCGGVLLAERRKSMVAPEESRDHIGPAYQSTPAKLQHFPILRIGMS